MMHDAEANKHIPTSNVREGEEGDSSIEGACVDGQCCQLSVAPTPTLFGAEGVAIAAEPAANAFVDRVGLANDYRSLDKTDTPCFYLFMLCMYYVFIYYLLFVLIYLF